MKISYRNFSSYKVHLSKQKININKIINELIFTGLKIKNHRSKKKRETFY